MQPKYRGASRVQIYDIPWKIYLIIKGYTKLMNIIMDIPILQIKKIPKSAFMFKKGAFLIL